MGFTCNGFDLKHKTSDTNIEEIKKDTIIEPVIPELPTTPDPEPLPEPEPKKTLREEVAELFRSQIGVRELTGKNDGVEVEMYLASTGLGKGYAWCAAFINWVLMELNIKTPKSAAWSPSWFPNDKIIEKDDAKEGDVFGIWFHNHGRIAHVGALDENWGNDNSMIITIEGNTNEGGSREGDGVYRKRRNKRQIYQVSNWID